MLVHADFSEADRAQLASRGITLEEAERQLQLLRDRPRPIELDRPCTLGDGIVRIDPGARDRLTAAARDVAAAGRVQKFVPASGAATRMFKDLIAIAESDAAPSATNAGRTFFDRLDEFPFADALRKRAGITDVAQSADEERRLLRTMLYDLRYAELPKALIPFHRVTKVRTPLEEHLLEGAQYTRDSDDVARTHFTVAPEFRDAFEQATRALEADVRDATGGTNVAVTFSEQQPSTDTLALGADGRPFREADGTLLLRPAGHGALLRNLQDLRADLLVIKNIDNVLPFERSGEVVEWKRLLIGTLVELQAEVWRSLDQIASGEDDESVEEALRVAAARFGRVAPNDLSALRRREFARDALDRPLRVCGVVKNEGEPGGAPFWIVGPAGERSMQIVESSQVDLSDSRQRAIFEGSTHFNPVDIVCALSDRFGRPYDLQRFVQHDAVFLTRKSHNGRDLVALERPGLWNGAMAHWNTVFVEVPGSTFAPVKTVFDLLRPHHQSS
jgi:hypothetical protein